MESLIDFRAFEERFQSALFFSLFEGLLPDGRFRFVVGEEPIELYQRVSDSLLKNCVWTYRKAGPDWWEVEIHKKTLQVNQIKIGS